MKILQSLSRFMLVAQIIIDSEREKCQQLAEKMKIFLEKSN
jgi:hypothetical protein